LFFPRLVAADQFSPYVLVSAILDGGSCAFEPCASCTGSILLKILVKLVAFAFYKAGCRPGNIAQFDAKDILMSTVAMAEGDTASITVPRNGCDR
jgi:hypothetical protein